MSRRNFTIEATLAAALRQDLYTFVQAFFPIVSAGDPLQLNWHLEAITYALMRVMRGEIKRLIIAVPPRHLKSICASVAFPAFLLGHCPKHRIICVSYSESLARTHANDCRALMRSPLYRSVFPRTIISPDKDSEFEFRTTERGYRLATSVGGTLTGRGGNIIIIDDPMKPQDAQSELARSAVLQWYGNTLLSRLDNKSTAPIIVVMQRLHVDDLAGHLIEQSGWHVLNLPAIAETDETVLLSPIHVYRRRLGEALHPEREPLEVLAEIKKSMGSKEFSAQYQQEPVPPGGDMIKWAWFRRYGETPQLQYGDRILLSWDTAGSVGELASYSACVVLLVRGDATYVLDVIRERLEYPDLKRKVLSTYQHWRSVWANCTLLIEDKGSGQSLIQDLRSGGIFPVAVNPKGDKVMRMHGHTARIEAGTVVLPQSAPWLSEFEREVMAFPGGRHNDQVDALSQGLDRAFISRAPVARTGRTRRV